MNTNQKALPTLIVLGIFALTPLSICAGLIVGWQWFSYDYERHPNWHIMNPEAGGFGQLGAIATYCGTSVFVGFVVGLAVSVGAMLWFIRRNPQ